MSRFVQYQVADAMTYRPITIGPRTTLGEAAALFETRDFELLPVTEEGCLLGVVGKVDLLRAFAFGPGDAPAPYDEILRRFVCDVMDRAPETVTPMTPLTALLHRMIVSGRCSFPVVIQALVVGVVTRADVTRALRCAGSTETTADDLGLAPAPPAGSRAARA